MGATTWERWDSLLLRGIGTSPYGRCPVLVSPSPSRHLTPYDLAECAWTIGGGHIEIAVAVPPNATADITLPGGDATPIEVGSGTHRWAYPYQDSSFPVA